MFSKRPTLTVPIYKYNHAKISNGVIFYVALFSKGPMETYVEESKPQTLLENTRFWYPKDEALTFHTIEALHQNTQNLEVHVIPYISKEGDIQSLYKKFINDKDSVHQFYKTFLEEQKQKLYHVRNNFLYFDATAFIKPSLLKASTMEITTAAPTDTLTRKLTN